MSGPDQLLEQLDREVDDLLGTAALVGQDSALADHVFGQLVDLLIERALCELRRARMAGDLDEQAYGAACQALAEQCQAAGLLPLASGDERTLGTEPPG